MLDGEVGDTAAGVELVGRGDRLRGAGGDAARTFPAVVAEGGVRWEIEGGEQLGEEEPGAEAAVDLDSGFSVPAEAGIGGEVALEDGAGVDIVALDAAEGSEFFIESGEAFLDELVVVVVPGIARDAVVLRVAGRKG